MNVRAAEQAGLTLQVVACWTAFVVVWWSAVFAFQGLESRGADLPSPAVALFAVARNGWLLLVPAIYTAAVVWLLRRGNVNAGWIGSVLVSVAILVLAFAVLGFASPHGACGKSV